MTNKEALFTSAKNESSEKDQWQTPLWLYNRLNEEFRFTLDVAATEENSLCEYYFDEKVNGLAQDWNGVCWCNPPYSKASLWFIKAYSEAVLEHATTVMLVAARTDTRHWWTYATKAEVRFLPGRLKFVGGRYSAPFPSALVIFHKDIKLRTPSTIYWAIREQK